MSSVKDSQPIDVEMLDLRRNDEIPAIEPQQQGKLQETPNDSHEADEELLKTRERVVKPRSGVSSSYMRSAQNETAVVPVNRTMLNQSRLAYTAAIENGELGKDIQKNTAFRFHNMLKLPQAHKWVIYEWFYSYIDKSFFEGGNEFQECLTQLFPDWKGRQLTRVEWRKTRAMLGKPRRCSKAFFDTERRKLESHRQKIRLVQLQQSVDVNEIVVNGRPIKIPLILPVGTEVTTWLHLPYIGFFSGTVVAFDAFSSVYRVAFDNSNLGIKSVPDFEIIPRNSNMEYVKTALRKQSNEMDSSVENSSASNIYPATLIACTKLTLSTLRADLERLTQMNNTAELMSIEAADRNKNASSPDNLENRTSLAPDFSEEFQRRYAALAITINRKNKDLQKYLHEVRTFSKDSKIFPEAGSMPPEHEFYEMCRCQSEQVVQRMNKGIVSIGLPLIQKLAKVLIVASHLGKMSNPAKERVLNLLKCSIEEVRSGLCGSNVERFLPSMETYLNILIAHFTANQI